MSQKKFFKIHRQKKLFRAKEGFELYFQGSLDAPLRLLAQALVQQFSEFFSESSIEDAKGRDRNQAVELPDRPALFSEIPDGEIFALTGSLFREEEDVPDVHEEQIFSELNDQKETCERKRTHTHTVQYDILARQTSRFLEFPNPSHIVFSLQKDLFPLQFSSTSFADLLQEENFHVQELRFAVHEFEALRSFVGPSPTVVHELLCDAKEQDLRLRIHSERHDPSLPFPHFPSGRALRFVQVISSFCHEFAREIEKRG